jgi:3-oxoacyl-(acyl-carrier-protein) synthase
MSIRRVVVTGVGLVAPVGLDTKSGWENILAGRSGIQPITHFDIAPFTTRFGGPIYGFDPELYVSKKDVKKMDKFIHYGIGAGSQAMEDAGSADPVAVRDAISQVNITEGPATMLASGKVSFDETGMLKDTTPVIIQWQDGVPRTVYPKSIASTEPIALQ